MRTKTNKGSALVMAFMVSIMLFAVMVSLAQFSLVRSQSAKGISEQTQLDFSVHGGIDRLKNLVTLKGIAFISSVYGENKAVYPPINEANWLSKQIGENSCFYIDSLGYYTINNIKIRCRIVKLQLDKTDSQSYYQLICQAVIGKRSKQASLLCKFSGSFAQYARFVSQGNLSIRSGAEYYGKVYAYSGINCNNESPIIFHEKVSSAGNILFDSGANYYKGKSEFVQAIQLPQYTEIETVKNGLNQSFGCEYKEYDPNDLIYDYKDNDFKEYFYNNTGFVPYDPIHCYITFKGDSYDLNLQAYTSAGNKSLVKANLPVPHNKTIWIRGYAYVKGYLSKRTTIYCQRRDSGTGGIIYIVGPIRYTDDSGNAQYKLYSNESTVAPFDENSQTWTYTAKWNIENSSGASYPLYKANPTWITPNSGNPVLGLVACRNIYIDANKFSNSLQMRNLEIHALLYSANAIIEARYFSYPGYNLIINGSIITTNGNILSSSYQYRNYMYDRNLMTSFPPSFPAIAGSPDFGNYHVKMIQIKPSN